MSTSRTAPRITICGIAEIGEHYAAGVTHVLSILGPNAADPPEFAAFAPHRRLILGFHDVIEPQSDQIAPTREDIERLLVFGREVSETPEAHLLVHCRAGVSRSTAAAALILMQANPEWPASSALVAVAAVDSNAGPCHHSCRSRYPQGSAQMGAYLPLAPGVSSVRYPIPQRTFKYVAAVQSVTDETCQ